MSRAAILCAAGALLAAGLVRAAPTPYLPPEGGDEWQQIKVTLKGADAAQDATGTAILACNVAETQHRMQLAAENLVKEGVYSVWLVRLNTSRTKTVGQTRVDDPRRPMKADLFGKLAFASNLSACPRGRYHQVQVRYHADGMPRRVKRAVIALKGDIP